MNTFEQLAETMLSAMDAHRHSPPEPVSGTQRGEMAVLRLLGEAQEGMSAGCISSSLHMTTSRIAAVLGSLEKKNMIVRTADPLDRRRVLVCLTQTGKSYHSARRSEAKAHMIALMEKLGEKDASEFVRLIIRIISLDPPPCPPSMKDDNKSQG